MSRKSVAVLDVRSSEITVVVGERGVNNTFVFKAMKTESYYGYQDGEFYDVKELTEAIYRAVNAVEQVCGERLRTLYIGVPGEFTRTIIKEGETSFPKRRRITEKDVEALCRSGEERLEGHRFIRVASTVYTTADKRQVIEPVGVLSTSLSGILTYFYCTEYFAKTMEDIFSGMKISLRFLPTQLAMALYLVPSETRDEYALFLDAGYLSSTVMILRGNGVITQSTFWAGTGQIAALLMDRFELSYDAAVELLKRTNLYTRSNAGKFEYNFRGETYEVDIDVLVETVKEGLDLLCEHIGNFLDEHSARELDYKSLYISGEGLFEIRGALEHISKRVNRVCEQLSPDMPYYNKPSMSSYIALVDMACGDHSEGGFFYKLLNGFGG